MNSGRCIFLRVLRIVWRPPIPPTALKFPDKFNNQSLCMGSSENCSPVRGMGDLLTTLRAKEGPRKGAKMFLSTWFSMMGVVVGIGIWRELRRKHNGQEGAWHMARSSRRLKFTYWFQITNQILDYSPLFCLSEDRRISTEMLFRTWLQDYPAGISIHWNFCSRDISFPPQHTFHSMWCSLEALFD